MFHVEDSKTMPLSNFMPRCISTAQHPFLAIGVLTSPATLAILSLAKAHHVVQIVMFHWLEISWVARLERFGLSAATPQIGLHFLTKSANQRSRSKLALL